MEITKGSKITIPAGTKVTRDGKTTTRTRAYQVTVTKVEKTRSNNTKVHWTGHGSTEAHAILKTKI